MSGVIFFFNHSQADEGLNSGRFTAAVASVGTGTHSASTCNYKQTKNIHYTFINLYKKAVIIDTSL